MIPDSRCSPLPVRVLGTGVHDAARVVTSAQLDAIHGRPSGTTFDRSGVSARRWAGPEDTSSRMAAGAVGSALAAAGLAVGDLDALVVSAVGPEQPMPTTAVLTLAELGAEGGVCEAFDVNASCVGFLTALSIASTGIASGRWGRVAVAASEISSVALNHNDIECSALFGDGSAAAILGPVGPGDDSAVLAARSAVWPEAARSCRIEGGGTRANPLTDPPPALDAYRFRMEGIALLRHVARHLPAFLSTVLDDARVTLADIDVVVPHQASGVGLRYVREKIGTRPDTVVDILSDHGNQVSASIPTALHHAVATGQLQRGDLVLLLGTGAGLSISATVLRY